jgi:hypothetical protein
MSKRSRIISDADQLEPVGAPAEVTSSLSPAAEVTEQEVADLAYQRWVERGCPLGSPEEDWFNAERELQLGQRSS